MRCLWVNILLWLCQITVSLTVKYAVKSSFVKAGLCGWHEAEAFFCLLGFLVLLSFIDLQHQFPSMIWSFQILKDLQTARALVKSDLKNSQKFLVLFLINVRAIQAPCGLHKGDNPAALFRYDGDHFSPLSDWRE